MNWIGLLIILGFVAAILAVNVGLLNLLRGKPLKPPLWLDMGQTWQRGRQAQKRQDDDLDELRRRVDALKDAPKTDT